MPLETVADRRAALEGYVYSPFRGDDLLHGIFGAGRSPEVAFQLFAGPEPRPDDLIHGSAPVVSGMPEAARLKTTKTFRVVDSTWSLAFATLPAFDAGSRRGEVALLLVIGLAISGMLFAVIRSQVRARGAAERVAADLARQARQMRALAETGRSLSEALDLDVVGRRITESLRSLVSVSRVTLYRLEPHTGDLRALATAAVDPAALAGRADHVLAGTAVIGRAVEDCAPVSTADLLYDPRIRLTPLQRERLEPTDNRAVLAVPLIVRDRVIGALSLGDQTGRVFGEEEIRLVRAFADQAAIALHNAQVYAETEQARGEATELAQAARDLTETLDVAAVGDRIVGRVLPLFSARLAIVRALEPDDSLRTIAASGSARVPFGSGHVLPAGIGLMGHVVTEGCPVWTADVRTDTRIARSADYTERLQESGTEAALAVPLRAKGRMIGVLGIADAAGRVFSEREVALLQAFADEAAVALENARLFAEAKGAEEALRDARDRLRALIEASPVAIITLDESGLVKTWNPAATTLFGWTADEVLDRPLPTVPEQRQGEYETLLSGYRRGEAVTGVETKRRRKDGSVVDVVLSVAPMTDAEGRALGSIGVMADVTQRKQLEQQLVQAQKMEAVGQLAGGVAHDFNNLLTVIGGRSALLLQRGGLNEPTRRDVDLIGQTAERAAALTRQLLAFSRKQILEPKPVDLNALVGGVAPMLRRLIGEHIELVIVPGSGLGHVMADPGQAEQVIMNLVVNARDAMPDGGMVKIETASRDVQEATLHAQGRVPPGPYVTLSVQDTGCGMDSVTLARIFEPFFTTKESGKGTGLGLSTVHGIVHQSGGYIGVDSAVGRGTTFTIYLPRITQAVSATEDPKVSPRDLMRGTEVVLVVEDEEEVRRLASEILKMCGYTILETGDPLEALIIAERRSGAIDLLLTDMVMPAMRGSELAERLGIACRGMRVLYMSGYTDEMIAAAGANEPARAFLHKPFTPYDLARRVHEALTRS
jgi:PAS domain S-box-containing protein